MLYEGKVYRPPSESGSLILQLTVGCPHNSCYFCSMYRQQKFKMKSLQEIKEHVLKARQFHSGPVRTIFLADGNSIIMKTDRLARALSFIRDTFPEVERITSYGSARFVILKSEAELRKLRKEGLDRIHTGMESGSLKVLEKINKGSTPEEIVEAGKRVKEAGMELSEYYLVGVGGEEHSDEHARESARVINRINPDFIRFRTFIPIPDTELYQQYQQGDFNLLSPHQALEEIKIFLENISGITSRVLSDHISNYWDISGKLPEDRERMLAEVEEALKIDESKFRDPARGRL